MPAKSGNAWKQERASVHLRGKDRPRSNKYAHTDNDKRPAAGSRSRVWVGGYKRANGEHVKGHYRAVAQH